ncbi:two-component sensor histidine kinase [Paenibacillus sp. CAA11]|uniref:sensor histidine kinase n=1 Tax=Paenibacillus sp. CAA11 TaxID=1532905 RepID=UPI000D3D721D|nr:HAMP domain-containing sensor histidine kinase [Paenibacillus sp. CAA11]AWB43742.1 two-component sensor histidine kinase [Paenibacillus sp. CAA11]
MKLLRRLALKILVFVAFFGCVAASWSASYVMLRQIYRLTGHLSSEYLSGLLEVIVSMVIFLNLAWLSIKLLRKWERVMYKPILDAMNRIGKGDFNVVLEKNDDYGEIVESINEMASELSRMETMRQDFISNVSHEIQSPLTSIRGFARALREDTLSRESRVHYLDIIEAESTRLSGLSDNLLKLSALEAGSCPFEMKVYRIDRQLRDMVLAAEPQWQGKQLEVEAELEPVSVLAVEELMSQVWTNLLYNSIKFTPRGGKILLRLSSTETKVRMEISDTGIGMDPEDLPHIFERFFKADKARSVSGGGSGLGLSIVKKIVELHEGSIQVVSQQGAGTTFTLELPKSSG